MEGVTLTTDLSDKNNRLAQSYVINDVTPDKSLKYFLGFTFNTYKLQKLSQYSHEASLSMKL